MAYPYLWNQIFGGPSDDLLRGNEVGLLFNLVWPPGQPPPTHSIALHNLNFGCEPLTGGGGAGRFIWAHPSHSP